MADEPKHTKEAAYLAIHTKNRLFVLWRNKWESEGTPLILPGGGLEPGESPKMCVIREVWEEIKVSIHSAQLDFQFAEPTEWTGQIHIYRFTSSYDWLSRHAFEVDRTKFSGYIWLPTNPVPDWILPLCMPGLRSYLTNHMDKLQATNEHYNIL